MPVERLENPATPEQYRVWHREGWLRTTPGPRIDYNHLFDDLIKILSDYQVAKIAFDPWNAEAFTQRIETEAGITRVKFLQTIHNFASPCRKLESMVASKKILHDGNPLLAWQIENTEVQSDSNQNLRPVKPDRSQGRKIDSVVALLMAIGLQELDLPNDWYVPGALRD
jgi:phage terminase large subunit-like protein